MDTVRRDRLTETISAEMVGYGVDLSPQTISELGDYYSLLSRWNERLHLVAPCGPEEFATRHVLESLFLLQFLAAGARVIDIGSGAGLPIIPCLIARQDISATLIESSQKKSVFLREAMNQLGIAKRAKVVARPFEDSQREPANYVTCRALDEFINKVPALIKWAPPTATLLLFGGESLRNRLEEEHTPFTNFLIPHSEKRFLFEVRREMSDKL